MVLGFVVHYVFVWLLAGLVDAALPPPSVWPALFGAGVGFTLLFGFGLPPVLQLARVPPLRVIRRDVGALKPASIAVLAAGALGFAALLLAVSSDLKLGLIAVGGFAGAVCVFALLSWLALAAAAPLGARGARAALAGAGDAADRGPAGVRGAAGLGARGRPARAGAARAAAHRPDLELAPGDAARTRRTASSSTSSRRRPRRSRPEAARTPASTRYDWFPMIRGRLVAIDGKTVAADDFADDRARRLVDREFNLSHSVELPAHNTVGAGRWTADEAGGLSVEEGLATTLGLKLGDTLRFDIGGQAAEGRITSLRKVDWSSMRVNFFVLFPTATDARRAGQLHRRLPRARGAGLRQRDQPRLPEHHLDRRLGLDRPDPARARPGRARGRVPVRLHARRRPGGAVRRGQRDARGAGARVRGDARARRQRPAAGAGAARRAARRRRAGRRARLGGGDRASAGRWRATCSSSAGTRRRWCRSPAASPARCSRSPPAGGACARC